MRVKFFVLTCALFSSITAFSQVNDSTKGHDYLELAGQMIENGMAFEDIFDVLKLSAATGNPHATFLVGAHYLTGHHNVPADDVKGLKHIEVAALAGLVNAQALLVREYKYGEHAARNEKKPNTGRGNY